MEQKAGRDVQKTVWLVLSGIITAVASMLTVAIAFLSGVALAWVKQRGAQDVMFKSYWYKKGAQNWLTCSPTSCGARRAFARAGRSHSYPATALMDPALTDPATPDAAHARHPAWHA